jgi:hypothetical protein
MAKETVKVAMVNLLSSGADAFPTGLRSGFCLTENGEFRTISPGDGSPTMPLKVVRAAVAGHRSHKTASSQDGILAIASPRELGRGNQIHR